MYLLMILEKRQWQLPLFQDDIEVVGHPTLELLTEEFHLFLSNNTSVPYSSQGPISIRQLYARAYRWTQKH
jgi:hypothetical protein